jgi:penicillin-binding protein A
MYRYMRRFGFNQEPPLDYPREQMVPSGVFEKGEILSTGAPVDMGRVAIGQERLQVTPLQMAMVAAAVGNGGELMTPHLVERVVAQDGRVTDRRRPREMSQVMSSRAAEQVGQMMSRVVEEGSGTAAALSGTRVAGKTGTAEVEGGTANQAWFIAFAPVDQPRMAIAVTVERTQGTGGEDAAPIAKRVLESLLGGGA